MKLFFKTLMMVLSLWIGFASAMEEVPDAVMGDAPPAAAVATQEVVSRVPLTQLPLAPLQSILVVEGQSCPLSLDLLGLILSRVSQPQHLRAFALTCRRFYQGTYSRLLALRQFRQKQVRQQLNFCFQCLSASKQARIFDLTQLDQEMKNQLWFKAAEYNDLILLMQELLRGGHVDINVLNFNGRTALHVAVVHNCTNVVIELLQRDIDVTIVDNAGATAQMLARHARNVYIDALIGAYLYKKLPVVPDVPMWEMRHAPRRCADRFGDQSFARVVALAPVARRKKPKKKKARTEVIDVQENPDNE